MPTAHVIQRPYFYSFSKNQITWRFYVPSPTDTGCKLQFKLMADTATNIAATQRVFETELRPASDGYLNVTVHDIVDSMIDYNVPVSAGTVIAAQNTKKVTVLYRRVSDTDTDPDWDNSEPAIYVIKGGIELLKHDYNNYFINYHGPSKVFATWLPKNRLVSINDQWWMSILFSNADMDDPDLTTRKLRTLLEYSDGSTTTLFDVIPATGFAYLLYHFNIGKIVKFNVDAAKTLWRFTVQVISDADDSAYSEAYTMYADYRQFYDYKIFNFYNSLGGMDHVRILAESEESYTRGFIEADLFANSIVVGSPADKQYFQANFSRLNSTKSDAGYRHTKAEALAYQELLTSGLIFEIWPNSNKYRLIGLQNKSGKISKTTEKRFGFPIEWRYPFTEQVYTPEIDLGVGINTFEFACALTVDITVVYQVTPVVGTQYYAANFYPYPDADHFKYEYSVDGGSTWSDEVVDIYQLDPTLKAYKLQVAGVDIVPETEHMLRITPYCTPTAAGIPDTYSFIF